MLDGLRVTEGMNVDRVRSSKALSYPVGGLRVGREDRIEIASDLT